MLQEHEDQKLKEILRDDFIDDPDDMMGQPGDEDLYPVQLPLINCARGFKEEGDAKGVAGLDPTLNKVEGWYFLRKASLLTAGWLSYFFFLS